MADISQRNATLDDLTPSQETAIGALLAGRTVTDAADAAGVNRATVHRWLKEDFGFQATLNRGRLDLREHLAVRLMRLAERAADAVERALDADDGKTALALLRGLGLLTGEPPRIGADDPEELRQDAEQAERLREKFTIR